METIVITGANRGIGLQLVKIFATAGYRVIATCRDMSKAASILALSSAQPIRVLPLDASDSTSIANFCSEVSDETIDILINNAGVKGNDPDRLTSSDADGWLEVMRINTIAPMEITQGLLPSLRRSQRPRVITISSQIGALELSGAGWHAYRSSKAAVNKVMLVIAQELRSDGFIVCPVHPGWVQTDMGGPTADLSVEDSASGLFDLITSMTIDHSGRFRTWDGREHPW